MNARHAILLVGSPKGSLSASESLGQHLLSRLAEKGLTTQTVRLRLTVQSQPALDEMLAAVNESEMVVLSFPLYVGALPALATRVLEFLSASRQGQSRSLRQRFLAIANCGMPAAEENAMGLAVCRRFAQAAGFEWAGGLAMGMGPLLGGKALAKSGRVGRHARAALDAAAVALAEESPLPPEAVERMARLPMPAWLYVFVANWLWKRQAKQHGALERMRDAPA